MQIFKNLIKISGWLLIPTLVVVGIVEHEHREASVNADRARLAQKGVYQEKQAVENLVAGCALQEKIRWLPSYLSERLFGNCRSLFQAPLNGAKLRYSHLRHSHLRDARLRDAILFAADLSDADLSDADLSDAVLSDADLHDTNLFYADLSYANLFQSDLSYADLSHAVLSDANLRDADLSHAVLSDAYLFHADLSHADLSHADLSYAVLSDIYLSDAVFSDVDLSHAILLNTDLRTIKELTQEQLEGDAPPLICNSLLPDDIQINKNRDCDQLTFVLSKRYPGRFASIDQAKAFVNQQQPLD